MAVTMLTWLFAIPLLGFATGLRTLTGIAVLCWFARLGYLPVQGTWAFWTASKVTVAIFTVLALGEFIGDKLPNTPNRTSPPALAARFLFAGLLGAIAATALKGNGLEGVVLAVVGALLGSFGGFVLRRDLVEKVGCKDWHVAVPEDLFTLLCAFVAMHIITA